MSTRTASHKHQRHRMILPPTRPPAAECDTMLARTCIATSPRLAPFVAATAALALAACRSPEAPPASPANQGTNAVTSFTTFADDIAFLSRHGHINILESPSGGRVAVSAGYQGRVMTSTV